MDAKDQSPSRIEELRVSARGWHGVQLAVLGFIGLCGVLQKNAGSGRPDWLQTLTLVLALAAFAVACVATVLVALAAWPVYAPRARAEDEEAAVASTSRRLRTGITLTYVAVAVLALAASSGWWPGVASAGQNQGAVQVGTQGGQLCGTLADPTQPGTLAVSAGGRVVEVALSDVTSLTPVDSC
jgi:hypothetical protein